MKQIKMFRYLYTYMHKDCDVFRWTNWTTEDWDAAKRVVKMQFSGCGFPKLLTTEEEQTIIIIGD